MYITSNVALNVVHGYDAKCNVQIMFNKIRYRITTKNGYIQSIRDAYRESYNRQRQ